MKERPYRDASADLQNHDAGRVLLKNVVGELKRCRTHGTHHQKLFAKHFDAQLLDVPLYRIAFPTTRPLLVSSALAEGRRKRNEDYNADIIRRHP